MNSPSANANSKPFFRRAGSFDHLLIRSAVYLLFVFFTATAFGQSGRRVSKPPPVSVPTPEAIEPEKKPLSDQPRLSLILGSNRGAFTGVPFYVSDVVLQSCAGRLKSASGVSVDVATKEMTRGDAVNRAKAAKEGYVVWLNLRDDEDPSRGYTDLDAVYIEYTVFEAITAKVKTRGNSYQGAYRTGGVVMGPSGRSSNAIIESRLRAAAEEAAARVLKAIHIASPADIPPH